MEIKVMGYKDGKLVEFKNEDGQCMIDIINRIYNKIETNGNDNSCNDNVDLPSKEMIDYDREYNIYEVLDLLKTMPTDTAVEYTVKDCQYRYVLVNPYNSYDLYNEKEEHCIMNDFPLSDLLDLKFKLIKEEIKEDEWVDVNDLSELMNLLEGEEVWKLKIDGKVYDFREYGNTNFASFTDLILINFNLENLANAEIEYAQNV